MSYLGALYDELRIDDRWQLSFYLMFVIRRTLFLSLGLFLAGEQYVDFQVMGAMYINLFCSIYIGSNLSLIHI